MEVDLFLKNVRQVFKKSGQRQPMIFMRGVNIFSTSYHNHKKQKQKFTKIMSKGGDESADISAGFHLHRRGGIAKVENLYLHL